MARLTSSEVIWESGDASRLCTAAVMTECLIQTTKMCVRERCACAFNFAKSVCYF